MWCYVISFVFSFTWIKNFWLWKVLFSCCTVGKPYPKVLVTESEWSSSVFAIIIISAKLSVNGGICWITMPSCLHCGQTSVCWLPSVYIISLNPRTGLSECLHRRRISLACVCLVTPTFAATHTVTERHVAWAVRHKCKKYQSSHGGEDCRRLVCNTFKLFGSVPVFFSGSCLFHYRYWWMRPYLPNGGCGKLRSLQSFVMGFRYATLELN